MLRSIIITNPSTTDRNSMLKELEEIAKEAISQAVARQKALWLPSYYTKNVRIIGRAANGRFIKVK